MPVAADRARDQQPVLAVVRGSASAEDIAAVVVALAGVRHEPPAGTGAPTGRRYEWHSRSRMLRQPLAPGPGAWRASALPR
jgi:Acyl-CoA carboxylase epsilon subunit